LARLWGFTVRLESIKDDGTVDHTYECKVPH